ncbi:hypothetical protein RFI_01075 [Reticulomyxa filosa]|uniref:Uncharacterized protein n=1 Tax=Reticulomyxa filosa TaxID=46433 RepID=X6PCQ7_RETFI|nr:hypothetical protein RFI_01075 [Reticulomyxa filosa]|eukprot:ETO35986.1 hypothetical protein RFI_01075 [Reticulomyxa filosa]
MASQELTLLEFERCAKETEKALAALRRTINQTSHNTGKPTSDDIKEALREKMIQIKEEAQKDQTTISQQKQLIQDLMVSLQQKKMVSLPIITQTNKNKQTKAAIQANSSANDDHVFRDYVRKHLQELKTEIQSQKK